MVSGELGLARRPTQVLPKLRIVGADASVGEVPPTVPASVGALDAMDRGRVIAMDSDTESVLSGVRSHHSFEDAFRNGGVGCSSRE